MSGGGGKYSVVLAGRECRGGMGLVFSDYR
jgi:hypothetical protein